MTLTNAEQNPSLSNARPIIKIAGQENLEFAQALTGLTVNQPSQGFSHGEVLVTNWTSSGTNEQPGFGYLDIELGDDIELLFQIQNEKQSIFKGYVTAIEERYGEGTPQIAFLLQDELHKLARVRRSKVFEDKSVNEVIDEIISGSFSTDVNVSSTKSDYYQMNESDLAFMLRLCNARGANLRLEDNTLVAKANEPDPDPMSLSAQDSALSVRIIADLNHLPTSTKVLGFNVKTGEIVDKDANSFSADGTSGKSILDDLGWASDEIMPQPFARNTGEAREFSKQHFESKLKQFLHGDIRCQGEPTLHAGREIELSGVSPRLEGKYQINHCAHRFDAVAGFETYLKVSKSGWVS